MNMLQLSRLQSLGFSYVKLVSGRTPTRSVKMSTAVNKRTVSPLLTLRTLAEPKEPKEDRRPLVIFFPWLYASPGAVDKYCDLYHRKDMDVLTVTSQLKHFLWPNTSLSVAKQVLEYLAKEKRVADREQYIVHGMSIGAFVYTVVMMAMDEDPKGCTVRDKIVAQVFDSLTMGSLEEMARGISQRAKNPVVQKLIQGGTRTYFFLTNPFTVKFYDNSVEFFKEKPLRTPVLIYYDLSDPMCNSKVMQDMINHWRDDFKMNVSVQCWQKSVHAGHLGKHPQDYTETLDTFTRQVLRKDQLNSKL